MSKSCSHYWPLQASSPAMVWVQRLKCCAPVWECRALFQRAHVQIVIFYHLPQQGIRSTVDSCPMIHQPLVNFILTWDLGPSCGDIPLWMLKSRRHHHCALLLSSNQLMALKLPSFLLPWGAGLLSLLWILSSIDWPLVPSPSSPEHYGKEMSQALYGPMTSML